MQTISVIGLGYIGLPTAVMFANCGYKVFGYDVLPDKVNIVNHGCLPFEEPNLQSELTQALSSGRFQASTTLNSADAYIISVPTPVLPDKTADLSFIRQAVKNLVPKLEPGAIVILESTSPPGTTALVKDLITAELGEDKRELANSLHYAHCPERVLPGKIVEELKSTDRVIGGLTEDAAHMAADLYRSFCQGNIYLTNAQTAEIAKLAENSFRDVNIAYANEIAKICERLQVNPRELIALANRHPRVNILNPGPGVGGHCIAVDPWFIVEAAPDQAQLIKCARLVNDSRPYDVIEQVKEILKAKLNTSTPTLAVLGIAFKPDVSDTRTSPAITVTKILADLPGVKLLVSDPHVEDIPAELQDHKNVELCDTKTALENSDLVVCLVSHSNFKQLQKPDLPVIDVCGLWDHSAETLIQASQHQTML